MFLEILVPVITISFLYNRFRPIVHGFRKIHLSSENEILYESNIFPLETLNDMEQTLIILGENSQDNAILRNDGVKYISLADVNDGFVYIKVRLKTERENSFHDFADSLK